MHDEITVDVEKLQSTPIPPITIGELPSAYVGTLSIYELELLKNLENERNEENE